ncbi:MAG: nucleotidyltransferase, partial [Desulfitobacteriaceae bacterium]|nr:nucleotidyltransferase [Desulfitobacteriaceae bacterium]
LMNKVFDNQVVSTQNTYKQYQLQFDAFSTFVTILDYLAKEKISLAQAIDSVPRFYMAGKEIECPWHAKGTVMRRLIEDQNRPADLIDGVKIFHENGWALVLPDSDEAVCRVYSEGMDMEIAEDLTTMYVNKVNNFKKQ